MAPAVRDLASVRGVAVGQAEDPERRTGVTACLFPRGAATFVDVRGGASATYDTASLSLDATFGRRWAIFFSGGSLFGLDAARGIRTEILEAGGGTRAFSRGARIAPISGAALYDLRGPDPVLADYLALGYEAARQAGRGPVAVGRHGAGTGATVAKYLGRDGAASGGVGSRAASLPGGGRVGVLVAVNSVGAVRDPESGRWLAAAHDRRGRPVPPSSFPGARAAARGTTLCLVVTDSEIERPVLARVASVVHAGLARTIVPYLTSTDGDLVFACSTGMVRRRATAGTVSPADRIGTIAADLATGAVAQAVRPERT